MMIDSALALNQYINSLQEPSRFFAFMGIYVGLPILCLLLLLLDKKLQEIKEQKALKKKIKNVKICRI